MLKQDLTQQLQSAIDQGVAEFIPYLQAFKLKDDQKCKQFAAYVKAVWHCVTPDKFQSDVVKKYLENRVQWVQSRLQTKGRNKYSHPLISDIETLGQLAEAEYQLCNQFFVDKTDTKLLFKKISKQVNIEIAQKLAEFKLGEDNYQQR